MKRFSFYLTLLFCLFSTYSFSRTISPDSLNAGYKIISKSAAINEIKVRQMKSKKDDVIYIILGNKKLSVIDDNAPANGISGSSRSEELKRPTGPVIKNVKVLKGRYGDMTADIKSSTQTIYTLKYIQFPLTLNIFFGNENFTLAFEKAGTWDVEVGLKN